jgi:hypothetical protein
MPVVVAPVSMSAVAVVGANPEDCGVTFGGSIATVQKS